jgi:signal transduction histidine kinase
MSIAGISREQEQNWHVAIENLYLHEALDAETLSRLREGKVLQVAQPQPLLQVMSVTNMQKMLIAPIHVKEQFTGMLTLHSETRKHPFSVQERKVVAKVIGTFIASIIERERLANEQAEIQVPALPSSTLDQGMSDFLSLMSHELRTPLTAIKSNNWFATNLLTDALQQVQEEETPVKSLLEDVRELLYRVDQLVGVQNRLVSELLEVSRLQVKKLDLQFRSHNLTTLVLQTIERVTHTAATNRLRFLGRDEKNIPVLVDGERIEQVLDNYIINALTYSPLEQPVDIDIQVQGQQARVLVHDEGPGLTTKEQEHLWERFYRVPRVVAQANSRGGLGLGLYLCRVMIEHHQGQVGVESIVEKGSTFWFTLPLFTKYGREHTL